MAEEKHKYTNHLIGEKSPYLQQHAHNPVDWYPWCDEAFVRALEEDKMIFLSIGYATCHWCHVMERESFENEELAEKLRESFISIKVDREELPQVDALYMEFAQSMMISSAGWPLNLILTPDLKPLFAGTYLPLHSRQGIMGLFELLQRMTTLWQGEEREQLESQAANLLEMTEENRIVSGDEIPPIDFIEETAEMIFKIGDPIYGGLKGHPKFPIGYLQTFLMHYALKSQDGRGLYLAERTLEKMALGGIFDQLGGGFCRYAVDVKWLTPHFEKMLYDNALLIEAYTHGYMITEHPLYKEVVKKTVNYVLRELTAPEGGFYSAEDSEIGGHEGTSNTWLYADVMASLGESGALFCEYYNITPAGNFGGRNILHIPVPLEEFARKKNLDLATFQKMIAQKSEMLFKIRNTAPKPLVDKKIITAWNGMMIHSLALAGALFGEKKWVEAATTAATFIEKELWQGDRLQRRWIESQAKYPGTLDDYAYLLRAYLTLFELDLGSEWLARAVALQNHIGEHFKVPAGAFYQISGDDTSIIMRHALFADGAEPSGNAIHCENLLRLYQLSGNRDYLAQAEDILATVTKFLDTYPPGYVYHLLNLQRYYDTGSETFVIALNSEEEGREEIAALLHKLALPHKTTLWRRENDTTLFQYLPFVKKQEPKAGKTTLYLCEKGACKEPIVGVEAILETLKDI